MSDLKFCGQPSAGFVPTDKSRICVAGVMGSYRTGKAMKLANLIAKTHSSKYESWFNVQMGHLYRPFLTMFVHQLDQSWHSFKSYPMCWLEFPNGQLQVKGDEPSFSKWALETFPENEAICDLAKRPATWKDSLTAWIVPAPTYNPQRQNVLGGKAH
eukprot:NODE_8995_length_669_cov_44.340659_g8732_i0.p1 GENE.NODE_8995_length_669_cov_44.340659_g8732_i0~~NODE_8995_length_669_cov_44.340659_g8732_i0.p1  ORF type:complete len:157 (-),score=22.73 NODE_8995_length_669_cov_44.340659_g8732_i0:140-610(-)